MADCSDNIYYLLYTDKTNPPIAVPKSSQDQTTVDITLLGKTRFEYGEVFNENVVHLLEHFASKSTGSPPAPFQTYANLLDQPTTGELWYDATHKQLNVRNATGHWVNLSNSTTVAGNSGFLAHGESLPFPVASDGYIFSYDECIWNVSPCYLNQRDTITEFDISVTDGVVSASYTTSGGTALGLVSYVILGVKGSSNTSTFLGEGCA